MASAASGSACGGAEGGCFAAGAARAAAWAAAGVEALAAVWPEVEAPAAVWPEVVVGATVGMAAPISGVSPSGAVFPSGAAFPSVAASAVTTIAAGTPGMANAVFDGCWVVVPATMTAGSDDETASTDCVSPSAVAEAPMPDESVTAGCTAVVAVAVAFAAGAAAGAVPAFGVAPSWAVPSARTVANDVRSPASAAPAAFAAGAPLAGAEAVGEMKADVVIKHSLGKITRARRPIAGGEPVPRLQRASH